MDMLYSPEYVMSHGMLLSGAVARRAASPHRGDGFVDEDAFRKQGMVTVMTGRTSEEVPTLVRDEAMICNRGVGAHGTDH